jgi:hypothetical protein
MSDRSSSHAIVTAKLTIPVSSLCSGLPDEFHRFLSSVRQLQLEEIPDYAGYRKMFRDLFKAKGFVYDYKYDWVKTVRTQLSFDFPAPKLLNERELKPVFAGLKEHSRPISRGKSRTLPSRSRSNSLKC